MELKQQKFLRIKILTAIWGAKKKMKEEKNKMNEWNWKLEERFHLIAAQWSGVHSRK